MTRLSNKEIKIEKFCTVFLWTLAILHFYFISIHSSMPAETSTKASGVIAEKVFSLVKNVTEAVQVENKKAISYEMVFVLVRKTAHLLNFYILGFLYCMAAFKTNGDKIKSIFVAVILCGLLGAIIDECHQNFIPGRSTQIKDVFIDFIGVFWGCITLFIEILNFKVKKIRRE